MDLVTIGTLATATMSAVAAIGSWRSAKHSSTVDQDRRRSELRPQLAVQVIPSRGDSEIAVMQVTLNGPVDLETPGKIRLKMLDLPSELRTQSLTVYQIQYLPEVRLGKGVTQQIWGPWEFRGGLRARQPYKYVYRHRQWHFAFGWGRPAKLLPTFRLTREDLGSGTRRRTVTAVELGGLFLQLAVYLSGRERMIRGVHFGETRLLSLSRTRPPGVLGDLGKSWDDIYPPDVWRVLAYCKFGRWQWEIELKDADA